MLHNKEFEVMKEFLGDYNKEIYGRELSAKVNMSHKNVSLILNKLEKKGILKSKTKGRIKQFSINKENLLSKRYILLTEVSNAIEFLDMHLKIKNALHNITGDIICIFGSYAKGIHKEDSDIDLMVVGKCNKKKLKEAGKFYGLNISIHNFSNTEFKKLIKKKNPLLNEIIKHHMIITGYEKFVSEIGGTLK